MNGCGSLIYQPCAFLSVDEVWNKQGSWRSTWRTKMFTSGCRSSINLWVASDMSNCLMCDCSFLRWRIWFCMDLDNICRCRPHMVIPWSFHLSSIKVWNCHQILERCFASWRSSGGGLESLFAMSSDSPCFGRAFWRGCPHWSGARQGFWLSTLALSIQTQILNSNCWGTHIYVGNHLECSFASTQ